jgi:hypothetical protein
MQRQRSFGCNRRVHSVGTIAIIEVRHRALRGRLIPEVEQPAGAAPLRGAVSFDLAADGPTIGSEALGGQASPRSSSEWLGYLISKFGREA